MADSMYYLASGVLFPRPAVTAPMVSLLFVRSTRPFDDFLLEFLIHCSARTSTLNGPLRALALPFSLATLGSAGWGGRG